MYVCLCNGISDKKIRQAVRQFSPHSFQQLKKFIPVGNQCGKCLPPDTAQPSSRICACR